jgi:hypothetical protein
VAVIGRISDNDVAVGIPDNAVTDIIAERVSDVAVFNADRLPDNAATDTVSILTAGEKHH